MIQFQFTQYAQYATIYCSMQYIGVLKCIELYCTMSYCNIATYWYCDRSNWHEANLVPRLFLPPVFDCLQRANMGGEGFLINSDISHVIKCPRLSSFLRIFVHVWESLGTRLLCNSISGKEHVIVRDQGQVSTKVWLWITCLVPPAEHFTFDEYSHLVDELHTSLV